MTRSIAFVGLGNMGVPMSRRLVDAGFRVHGFDLSEEARERAAAGGVTPHGTAAEAAGLAQTVILMLPSSDVVDRVVEGLLADGSIGEGALVVDMSSSDPLRTRALAERTAGAGARLVDAPVSGGVKGAENGTLTIMIGGERDGAAEAAELLAPLGRTVVCGPVGAGHAVKALNNLLSATHLWATGEAIEAGKAFGLDPETMLEVFNTSSGRSGSTENKWPNFVLTGGYDSGFGLRLMLKDMKIATALAQQLGVPSGLGDRAVDAWQQAADELPADADHTRVAEWIAAREQGG